MLCANAVMGAEQPRLEVSEYEMDHGQEIVGHFRIAAFGNGLVVVAQGNRVNEYVTNC